MSEAVTEYGAGVPAFPPPQLFALQRKSLDVYGPPDGVDTVSFVCVVHLPDANDG